MDVDPHDHRSIEEFLEHPPSVDRFIRWVRAEHSGGAPAVRLLSLLCVGHRYHWPDDDQEELDLLLLAANTCGIKFSYRIDVFA